MERFFIHFLNLYTKFCDLYNTILKKRRTFAPVNQRNITNDVQLN
ncbi:hypothetical protein HMPREF9074_08355 [Capnocytophaga sp. oral taxon 329 str. F0087]|nr:hypothetical protein HMPREF9074_08355 [Capnocytophaga sp. oral taxon 329 str. F0087]